VLHGGRRYSQEKGPDPLRVRPNEAQARVPATVCALATSYSATFAIF
jgi:hypothetical protein